MINQLGYLEEIFQKWDKELMPFIAKGNAIYLAVLSTNGIVLYANNAMSFLKNATSNISFVNPTMEFILSSKNDGAFFDGIMTFGEINSVNNFSVLGKIFRKNDEILIVAELNIDEIVSQNKMILELNTENSNLNRKLIKEKNALQLTQEELLVSKTKLIELNATKDKFFSIIAHDLRNPLGTFKNMTELLYDSYNDFSEDDRIEILELLKNSSKTIYSLLENLLEWSRSQRGKLEFNPIVFELNYIVEETMQLVNFSAMNKNIKLINNINKSLQISADLNIIKTVIRNLLSNAIKFTYNGGEVSVSCSCEDKYHIISVTDTGIGMTLETINKLFRIDINVTNHGTNGEEGTGLGLILCKEFVEKHGGKIWVESEIGRGSTFYFTIPKLINNK